MNNSRFINNDAEQIELRKVQNTLIVVGTGIILFNLWTAFKSLSIFFILRKETVEILKNQNAETQAFSNRAIFLTMLFFMVVITAIVLAIRLYVGFAAISEGRGKRRKPVYLVFVFFMILTNGLSLYTSIFARSDIENLGAFTKDQSIPAIIVELTSLILLIELFISAVKIRRLTRKEIKAKG